MERAPVRSQSGQGHIHAEAEDAKSRCTCPNSRDKPTNLPTITYQPTRLDVRKRHNLPTITAVPLLLCKPGQPKIAVTGRGDCSFGPRRTPRPPGHWGDAARHMEPKGAHIKSGSILGSQARTGGDDSNWSQGFNGDSCGLPAEVGILGPASTMIALHQLEKESTYEQSSIICHGHQLPMIGHHLSLPVTIELAMNASLTTH